MKSRYETLINSIIENTKNIDATQISLKEIKSKIMEACKQAKSTDGIDMNITQALRYLANFKPSEIEQKINDIKGRIQEIYKSEQVNSEFYYLEQANDKHFYMVKVTGKNSNQWKSFILEQQESAKISQANSNVAHKNVGEGHIAFVPMLKYHDQDLTDVWVAFFADKKIIDSNNIDFKSIEIAVTVNTSQNAKFFSPVGIARNINYEGIQHKNLTPEFFSCIAKVVQEHYTEEHGLISKIKLINQPAMIMQEILFKIFKNENSFLVGDSRNTGLEYVDSYFSRSLEELLKFNKNLIMQERNYINTHKFHTNIVAIELNKQKNAIEKGEKYMSIKLEGDNKEYNDIINNDFKYKLLDKDGNPLQSINAEQAKGEYAWYFVSPFLFKGSGLAYFGENPCTISVDVEPLTKLVITNNPIEHWSQIEAIGDVPIYQD